MDVLDKYQWVHDKKSVDALTIEEYHEASGVYSVLVRDQAIINNGLEVGYYKGGLAGSESRSRLPHLKNTSRGYTLRTINGRLYDIAESIGGDILKGYREFMYVNSCSSRLTFRFEPGGLWDLNYRYYEIVKEQGLYDFGHCAEDTDDYIEYSLAFGEFYGTHPELYGDWEFFYNLWNRYMYVVADKYLDDMRGVIKRRLDTPSCSLGPCETCDAIVDCGIYEYKEKIV